MVARFLSAILLCLGAVVGDRRGATAVFLAVSLVPLIGAVGLAVNSSIGYLLRTRMGKSLDTAGLAAGRIALDANAEAVAEQYFDANFDQAARPSTSPTSTSPSTRPPHRHAARRGDDADALHARLRPRHHERRRPHRHRARDHRHGARAGPRQHRLDVRRGLQRACRTPPTTSSTSSTAARAPSTTSGSASSPYVSTVNIGSDAHGLARRRATGCSPTSRASADSTDGWKGCVMGAGHALRRRRHPDRVAEAHLLLLRRDLEHLRQQLADDQDQHRPTRTRAPTASTRTRRGPNLGCGRRSPADASQRDDRRPRSARWRPGTAAAPPATSA